MPPISVGGNAAVDDEFRTRHVAALVGKQEDDAPADVVRLTAYGYSNKEIAAQLDVSVKTVDTYKMRAMGKLGLHSRAALVRYALQRGWLDQS